jgi:hypothetical protein
MAETITLKRVESIPFDKSTMRVNIPEVPDAYVQWEGPSGPDESIDLHLPNREPQGLGYDRIFTVRTRYGPDAIYQITHKKDWNRDWWIYLERFEQELD